MKLSKRTLAILKNFAAINQSIVIKPGKKIETISDVKDMFANAPIEEEFPVEVAIYDLNEFLGVVSLFDDPEFTFEEKYVTISQGSSTQRYYYADGSVITQAPEKGVTLPSTEVSASLTREQYSQLVRAAAINNASDFAFTNGDVKVYNKSIATSNSFSINGVASTDANYNLSIAVEKIKMLPDDYKVDICAKGLAHFKGDSNVEYYVALQVDGKYETTG